MSCFTNLFFPLVINCGDLPGPDNGLVTITIGNFGSNASYTCETGYNLNGDMTRMCQDSGDWSGTAPTCDRKLNYMALLYCFYDLIFIHCSC